jgi:CheY-like chemotaxis protein
MDYNYQLDVSTSCEYSRWRQKRARTSTGAMMAGEKVLVIEDNPVNMELAADLLELAGYVVLQAGDAGSGIEMARSQSPHLILMDVGLPGMDGLAAAGILLQDDLTRRVPVVLLTAHAMKGDEEKARDAGCVGYITKPIDTRTFAATVAALIAAHAG